MTIAKGSSLTISTKDNGFEVAFSEANPNFTPIKLDKDGEYLDVYNEDIHSKTFYRRYVFTNQPDMIKFIDTLTT